MINFESKASRDDLDVRHEEKRIENDFKIFGPSIWTNVGKICRNKSHWKIDELMKFWALDMLTLCCLLRIQVMMSSVQLDIQGKVQALEQFWCWLYLDIINTYHYTSFRFINNFIVYIYCKMITITHLSS